MKVNENKLIVFESKNIRRVWNENEWYYSVVDICGVLTNSKNPRDYWYRVKKRVGDEEKAQLSTICRQLKLDSVDGKNTEKEIGRSIISDKNYLPTKITKSISKNKN